MKTDEMREAIKPAEASWFKYERHRTSCMDHQGLMDRQTDIPKRQQMSVGKEAEK